MKRHGASPGGEEGGIAFIGFWLAACAAVLLWSVTTTLSTLGRMETAAARNSLTRQAANNLLDQIMNDIAEAGKDGAECSVEMEAITHSMGQTGVRVAIQDLSSRINLNTITMEEATRMGMDRELQPGYLLSDFQSFRRSVGPTLDIESSYGFLFPSGRLGKLFTAYGFACNRPDDSTAALPFPDFPSGPAGAATWNIHFAPEELIQKVLGSECLNTAGELILLRENREIRPCELDRLIPGYSTDPWIRHWLGTRTWFWKIHIQAEKQSLNAVAVRIPQTVDSSPDASEHPYMIVERRWE